MPPLDFVAINAAGLQNYEQLCEYLFPGGRVVRGRWCALNPTRSDTHVGSFSVDLVKGIGFDFATNEGFSDPVSAWAYRYGCKQGEAAKQLADWLGLPGGNGSMPPPQAPRAEPKHKEREQWVAIKPPADVTVGTPHHFEHGAPSVIYEYRTAKGNLIAAVCRFANGPKAVPYVYCKDKDGNREWRWQGFPDPRPLYGRDILAANPDALVVVVEGEKCADAINQADMSIVAVTWQGGASTPHLASWSALKDRDVVCWPDNDEPGLAAMTGKAKKSGEHKAGVADMLKGVARRVRMIAPLVDKPKGWDVADALAEGWTADELAKWIRDQAEPIPALELVPVPAQVSSEHGDDHLRTAATFGMHDDGNALRLLERFGSELMFVPGAGWHVWDGKRWKRDYASAFQRAVATVRRIDSEAALHADKEHREAKLRWARTSQMRRQIKDMLSVAEMDAAVRFETTALDRDPWALNCQSGTIDLRTGQIRDHSQADRITCIGSCEYDPDARYDVWERYLSRVFMEDADLMAFMQRAAGYAATGLTVEHALFFLYGNGSNGKTKMVETITHVLGDYAQQAPADTLMQKNSGGIPNDIARMRGARLVAACESDDGARLAEALVKQLTGGDKVTARFMRQEYFTFMPTLKLWLSTNHRPQVRGTDNAIWRRIKLIPFNVTIPDEEQDKGLGDKLQSHATAILAWIVAGAKEYSEHGLGAPAAVTDATADYRKTEDALGEFLSECCVLGEQMTVMSKDLRVAYEEHCKEVGISRPFSPKRVGAYLTEQGMVRERANKGIRWVGLGLRSGQQPDDWANRG